MIPLEDIDVYNCPTSIQKSDHINPDWIAMIKDAVAEVIEEKRAR